MSDEPIPAATLVVVRDRADGPPELLMVERAAGMAFAGGALVFPGGRIDQADRSSPGASVSPTARRGWRRSARRSRKPRSRSESSRCRGFADALEMQRALVADRPFGELLDQAGLGLDPAALTPLARWLPNFHVTRRFDTLFFLARAPAGDWQPNVIAGECSGAFGSPPPTRSSANAAATRG